MGGAGRLGDPLVYPNAVCERNGESDPGADRKRFLFNIPNASNDDDRVRLFDETSRSRGDAYSDRSAVSGCDRGCFWSARSLPGRTSDSELAARSSRARAKPAEEVNHGQCPKLSRSGGCEE